LERIEIPFLCPGLQASKNVMIVARHSNNETDTMDQPKRKDIEQYKHKDKTRLNNPQVGMVSEANDPNGNKKRYSYDPHLDPTLVWTGKKEQSELDVDTVSIHVHERIDPKTIVHQVHKNSINSYAHGYQVGLFEQPFDHRPVRDEVSFYQHKNAWANRLIAGDSLLVMNSLLEKEGMAGQVQTIYFDPPYGIKYGSNFQPFTNQKEVIDGRDDSLNTEPEMLKAFRDTWELGIHSYLTYMRDRLLLSRELLTDSGSIFVQISDENLHYVRQMMEEVFGQENFVSQINFTTTSGFTTTNLSRAGDHIVWFAKNKKNLKYRQLYLQNPLPVGDPNFRFVELSDGTRRPMTGEERQNPTLLPKGSRIYRLGDATSQGRSSNDEPVEFEGELFNPSGNRHWTHSNAGMQKLIKKGLVVKNGNNLSLIRYYDNYQYRQLTDMWSDTSTGGFNEEKNYVVQTSTKVIQRCILMTTDPGDLVLDPTCGSGTTAYVAEQWGRRWITIDTSRISLQLAKQRLMTAVFDWYKLAHEAEGVAGGFNYYGFSKNSLKAIANDEPPQQEDLYDEPETIASIVRVSGPFTTEAIPAVTVKPLDEIGDAETADNSLSRTGETARQDDWRSELLKTGVRTKGGAKIEFARVELLQGTRYLHAEAETIDGKRVLVSFGPDAAPLEQKQVEMAIEEANQSKPSPQLVLFAAFQFDPEASKDIDETNWAGVELLKVQMNTDLLTSDLKKSQSSSESFWLVGQPDVQVVKDGSQYVVSVEGFDYYNPKTGEVQSGGKKEIAMWMLDTDYDGRSIFPTQVFFPMAGAKDGWNKLAKNLKAELDEDLLDKFEGTESIAFDAGDYKRCAVKIIDNRGIESLTIKNLE
jgi:adenine-specific DNA-methyltransferase